MSKGWLENGEVEDHHDNNHLLQLIGGKLAMASRSRTKLLLALKEKLSTKRWGTSARWIDIRVADALTDYFPAGGPAVVAFVNEMNNSPPMSTDKIRIEPGEVRDASTVGDLFDAEKTKYRLKFTLE